MTQESSISGSSSLIPPCPTPDGAEAFSRQVHSLLDGRPKDDATLARAFHGMDEMFDHIAAGFYTLASMLVGEGEESVRVVETAVATADVSTGATLAEARQSGRRALAKAALEAIARRAPSSFAVPEGVAMKTSCLDEDDLESSGVSAEEIERIVGGHDRDRVRAWLEKLPMIVRTVFVLRAVAGFTAIETAALLTAHGGPSAAAWNPEMVRAVFRQGLCSLASQLIHASPAQ